MAEIEYTFLTKDGKCSINGEKILLNREGIKGRINEAIHGNSMTRSFAIYGIVALAAIGFGIWGAMDGETVNATFGFAIGLIVLVGMAVGWNASATNEISLSSVREVKFLKPSLIMGGLFTIYFEQDSHVRKRYIMLPKISQGGSAEFESAMVAFRSTGLIK